MALVSFLEAFASLKHPPAPGATELLPGSNARCTGRGEERKGRGGVVLSGVLTMELSSNKNVHDCCFEASDAEIMRTIGK